METFQKKDSILYSLGSLSGKSATISKTLESKSLGIYAVEMRVLRLLELFLLNVTCCKQWSKPDDTHVRTFYIF